MNNKKNILILLLILLIVGTGIVLYVAFISKLSLTCPKKCLNGGICDTLVGSCKCVNGYTGIDCANSPFLPQLVDWLKTHAPTNEVIVNALQSNCKPYNDDSDQFWVSVAQQLISNGISSIPTGITNITPFLRQVVKTILSTCSNA